MENRRDLYKAIKLVEKLEKIEENFNKTQINPSSNSTVCSSYSTTPFLVCNQLICKINKDRIQPVLKHLPNKIYFTNNIVETKKKFYSKKLKNQLLNLIDIKKCRKNKKKCALKKLLTLKKNKLKRLHITKNTKFEKLISKTTQPQHNTQFCSLSVKTINNESTVSKQKEHGANIRENKINEDMRNNSRDCSIKNININKYKNNKSEFEHNLNKNTGIDLNNDLVTYEKRNELQHPNNVNISFKSHHSVQSEKTLKDIDSKSKDFCFLKPQTPGRRKFRTNRVKTEGSINKIKCDEQILITVDTNRKDDEQHLTEIFKRIELWKQYGSPWINEIMECGELICIPSVDLQETKNTNHSTSVYSQPMWQTPNFSPILKD